MKVLLAHYGHVNYKIQLLGLQTIFFSSYKKNHYNPTITTGGNVNLKPTSSMEFQFYLYSTIFEKKEKLQCERYKIELELIKL